jgi:polar amino acid transport system substrate-binding protein
MKTWSIWFVALVVVALMVSGCGSQQTPQAESGVKTYVVATDAAFPPMEFVDENKEIVGFDIDLLNAIADEMGFAVEYKNTAWDGIFAGLESGDYDAIISAVTIRPDRADKYDFTEPYINAGQAIVVLVDETGIEGKDDLSGRRVGAQIGTTGAFAVQEIGGAVLREYDTIDLALLDLVSGNVDAVVVDTPVAADYALASDQFAGRLRIVGDAITEEFYGALVNKGQNADFLEAFNQGLERLRANGTYDEIYGRWISGEGSATPLG